MKVSQLRKNLLQERDRNQPYYSEKEYLLDCFSFLDICLHIACYLKESGQHYPENQKSSQENISEVMIPVKVLNALQSFYLEKREVRLSEETRAVLIEARDYIEERISKTMEQDRLLKMQILSYQFHLSEFEEFLLLLSLACDFDSKYEEIFSYLQEDKRLSLPTKGLAIELYQLYGNLEDYERGRCLEGSGRFYDYLVTCINPFHEEHSRQLECFKAEERIYSYLLGTSQIDKELDGMVELKRPGRKEKILIREPFLKQIENIFVELYKREKEESAIIQIIGMDGIGKKFMVNQISETYKIPVLYVKLQMLINCERNKLETRMKKIIRESVLWNGTLCFIQEEGSLKPEDLEKKEKIVFCQKFLFQKNNVSFWISSHDKTSFQSYDGKLVQFKMPILSNRERKQLLDEYRKSYPVSDILVGELGSKQYFITPRGIQKVLDTADLLRMEEGEKEIGESHVRQAVSQHSLNQIGEYAKKINAVFTWNDLVLEEEKKKQMKMICDQVKYRSIVEEEWGFQKKTPYGRGICALFYGASGTGKTMAAQVMANELGLDLYRIDLSQLVSKYIGETEKNISELFERAKYLNAVLLFDEADALFAKRSQVKNSNDRHANGETAHLLQKLEDYEGITILATNYANNIDDAFKRRIKFMIPFLMPSEAERLILWKKAIPSGMPIEEEIDTSFYAKQFELSGSRIKEIITNAAYLGAANCSGLKNKYVMEAVTMNYAKYGHTLSKEEWGYLA